MVMRSSSPGFGSRALAVLLWMAVSAGGAAPALAAPPPDIQRSVRHYRVPEARVQAADGQVLTLKRALSDGRPVVLSFMFSSCLTVCPITNQTLVQFEALLGPERARVHVVSMSIDPDHDTVSRLADFARQTGASGSFYTSDPGTSEAIQRAFDVWRGDKMNHQPVFLLARDPDKDWVRLEGLVSPRILMKEYRALSLPPP